MTPDDSARDAFKARVRGRESGTNDRAVNGTGSSASGRYQFTRDTWVRLHQRLVGGNMTANQRWAQRFDPHLQERFMDASVDGYTSSLRRGGQAVTDGNLYLSHFFGPETAVRILRNPGASLRSILGRHANAVFAQNPNLNERMTGQDAINLTTRAMSGRAPSSRPAARPDVIYSDGRATMDQLSRDEVLNMRPDSISRRPLEAQAPDPTDTPVQRQDQRVRALTGGRGLPVGGARPNLAPNVDNEHQTEAAAVEQQTFADAHSGWERFEATFEDWIGTRLIESISRDNPDYDPAFSRMYAENWQTIEGFAQDDREVYELREANSADDLLYIQNRIEARRARDRLIDSGDHPFLMRLAGGISDPVGVIGGLGAGELLNTARVGGRALMAAGRPVAGVTSHIAENVGVNLGFTGILDATGDYMDSSDYNTSALFGLGIGTVTAPFVLRGGRPDLSTYDATVVARDNLAADQAARMEQARTNLGADAPPEAVAQEAQRLDVTQQADRLRTALSPVPDELRLLSENPEETLTANAAIRGDVETRHGLGGMHDDAERALTAELIARAERITELNPVNPAATDTLLTRAGMESTATTLLRSESPVARAVGTVLLESPTGATGRRVTAAMQQAQRERVYNRFMTTYDQLYHMYRRERNVGIISEAHNGNVRREFNARVFDEVEARAGVPEGTHIDSSPMVREAADLWERGMNAMRIEQQHVDVVGSARLGQTSRGYMTHRLDATKVAAMTPKQRANVRNIIAGQLSGADNGFDAAFAKKLATKYLERAERRVGGSFDVPMNLWSPEAADIVRDSLAAMKLGTDEIEKLMGKFSRGGASHTKQRLRLDLTADIGDGMVLRDLYNTDIAHLYHGYARRVSGEVALAQYGIMGKKGLNMLRTAIDQTAPAAERANTLRAFDQISSEFLNTPFGDHNHIYMDNIRIATSLARLGGMGFTQVGEYGNALAALGVHRTFAAIGSLRRLRTEVTQLAKGGEPKNPILQSLDLMGGHLGTDDFNATRMFDIRENNIQVYGGEHIGVVSRTLRSAGHMQAVLSGHRTILAVQTRGMAEQIIRKAVDMVRKGGDDIHLNDMGFTPELRDALRRNLDQIATFDKSGRLVELDLFNGDLSPHEIRTMSQAVERGAGQIIQRTYTGETGKWAHNGMLKLLLQFRTFSLIAVEKQWGRGVNMRGGGRMAAMRSAMVLMGAMSFAAPIYLARVHLRMLGMSRSEREKYAENNLSPAQIARATLNYASAAGLLPDILDIGGGAMQQFGDGGEQFASALGARGQGRGKLIGGAVAPGVGLVEDIWSGLHNLGDNHSREKLLRALPGSNLPFVAPILNEITAEE